MITNCSLRASRYSRRTNWTCRSNFWVSFRSATIFISCIGNLNPVGKFSDINSNEWVESVSQNSTFQIGALLNALEYRNIKGSPSVIFFAGGGTLMLDHCSSQSPMIEEDWVIWSNLLFPETSWETMNRSHDLSYSFYLLEKKMLLGNEGVPIRLLEHDGRFIMIWNRSKRFSWETMMRNQVRINPNPTDIETGLRFYVNLAMYLLTGDYKTDQLHLPTILLRRK